jgi:hypothetical protein
MSLLKVAQKHRFWVVKAMLLVCKTSSFVVQKLCFGSLKVMLWQFGSITFGFSVLVFYFLNAGF